MIKNIIASYRVRDIIQSNKSREEARKMSNQAIRNILDMHYIENTTDTAGRVYAVEEWTYIDDPAHKLHRDYVDMTEWTRQQVYDWLGY